MVVCICKADLNKKQKDSEGKCTEWRPSERCDHLPINKQMQIMKDKHCYFCSNFVIEKRKKRVMISQPMADKTDLEIMDARNKAKKHLEDIDYEVVDSLFDMDEDWLRDTGTVYIFVRYLGESIKVMSLCHAVYFCKGWENARGCLIEHEVAKAYGLEIIYEEGTVNE